MNKLYRLLPLLLALAGWIYPNLSFADCSNDQKLFYPCNKTYVVIDRVTFLDNSIRVALEDKMIETSAIYCDDEGYYFRDFSQGCDDGYWECRHCHHCNPVYKFFCEVCWN